MEQRISLVTLGVRDVTKSATFYEAMGWKRVDSQDGIVVFDLIGQALGLYPRADLARDMGLEEADLGTGGSTVGYNVRDKDEVAQVLTRARKAGARILKDAHDVFWGGHVGYFADPDGHVWEVSHNPFSPLRKDDGAFRWSGYE